jgi:hypothetical protein
MCWVLYLAADRSLPLRPFYTGAPGFNVAEPTGREIEVRVQFSKPFVYALGAHTSCGCGFDRGQAAADQLGGLEAIETSLRALRDYLDEALELAGPVELFACWDGDQAARPDNRWKRSLADFSPDMPWFPERTFVEVTQGGT